MEIKFTFLRKRRDIHKYGEIIYRDAFVYGKMFLFTKYLSATNYGKNVLRIHSL